MGKGTKVHTDCRGIVKRSDKLWRQDNFSQKGHASQFRYIKIVRREGDMDLVWVPSHPERREPDSDSWKVEDWGIWFADRVAGGERQDTMPGEFHISEHSMEEAAIGHDYESNWYFWKQEGMVMLNSLTKVLKEERSGVYLNKRDEYRRQRGEEPMWENLTIGYAAKSWRHQGKGLGISARNRRLMYNKIWDGRNEGKGLDGGKPLRCKACKVEDDGMDHWVGQCTEEGMTKERKIGKRKIESSIKNALSWDGEWRPSEGYKELLKYVKDKLLGKVEIGRLWCALWSEVELLEMERYMERIQEGEVDRVQKFFVFVGIATTEAVSEIWEARKKAVKEEAEEVGRESDDDEGEVIPDPFEREREGLKEWLRSEEGAETGEFMDKTVGKKTNRRRTKRSNGRRQTGTYTEENVEKKKKRKERKRRKDRRESVIVNVHSQRRLRQAKGPRQNGEPIGKEGQRDIRSYFQREGGGADYG